MPADALFEIGCEEIPAKLLSRALAELPALVEARLGAARLGHAGVRALGTPRRLAVIIKQLAERQPDLNEEVVGPPASAAFAADGSLSKAGQGFAAKNAVDPQALVKREIPGKKGLYVVALRRVPGQDTRALLPDLLTDVARSIAWQKSQRWGWSETAFVRPVHWLVALLGGEVVPLSWAGATSGRHSRGHRFLANRPIEIAAPAAYVEALRAAHVVVDPDARRELVRAELVRIERETGLRIRPDDALLAEVVHLGEYPVAIAGSFDPAFLEVPEDIIVTAMRNHQRYFALEDAAHRLAPRFATVMATVVADPAVVQHGNESVLASRLADARFFFAEDRKKSFDQWNDKLGQVVFQAKLGDRAKTIGHKIQRLIDLTTRLAVGVKLNAAAVYDAAHYAKSDLASSAVGEFPELQGVMGRHYARLFGYSETVAAAIDEHWWPKGGGGQLPTTPEGALIGLADRIDTLVGCFATGLQPSGSADPFGLRRAAIGVVMLLIDRGPGGDRATVGWPTSTAELIRNAASCYGDSLAIPELALGQLDEFLAARLRGLLLDQGLPAQDVDAVLAKQAFDPSDVQARARAVGAVPRAAREVFKRIANILDDATAKRIEFGGAAAAVDDKLFAGRDGAEAKLWGAFDAQRPRLSVARATKQYRECFEILAGLGAYVAAFFDRGGVMVMDPDPVLRKNRLDLLSSIYNEFADIVDFRLLGGAA
jgi:glycyl-tRNA synthetase beta chain